MSLDNSEQPAGGAVAVADPVVDLMVGDRNPITGELRRRRHRQQGNGPIALRDYQEEAVRACLRAFENGQTRIAVSAPTGSGKTTMFVSLIPRIPNTPTGKQVLILVHNIELARQVHETIRTIHGNRYTVGLEQGENEGTGEDIIIATWQSMKQPDRLGEYNPAEFKLVIVDEAHHACANSYLYILQYFHCGVDTSLVEGFVSAQTGHHYRIPIVGFSATLVRDDSRALEWVFQQVVYDLSLDEMLRREFLCPVEFMSVWDKLEKLYEAWDPLEPEPNEEEDKEDSGPAPATGASDGADIEPIPDEAMAQQDGEEGEADELHSEDDKDDEEMSSDNALGVPDPRRKKTMNRFTRTAKFAKLLVEEYQDKAHDRKSTLIFCANLKSVRMLLRAFREAGYDKVHAISGFTPEKARKDIMRMFKIGMFPILINCLVLTEGADMPVIDCVLLARPTRSRVYFSQMVGRGMRLSPGTGKNGCLVLDFFAIFGKLRLGVEPCLRG